MNYSDKLEIVDIGDATNFESPQKRLAYGIEYLDRATGGLRQNEVCVLGAYSGSGKTQLITKIAFHNAEKGKKVYLFALEAEKNEIARRKKFSLLAPIYYSKYKTRMYYRKWLDGEYPDALSLEPEVNRIMNEKYDSLYCFYRNENEFTVNDLETTVDTLKDADLIIIDHLQYIDLTDDNENRAYKQVVQRIRNMALVKGIPFILVAHLRKKDRKVVGILPDVHEFFGSSDIIKIATQVIVLTSGGMKTASEYYTLFKVLKFRNDMGVCHYVGRHIFDSKTNDYDGFFKIGLSSECFSEFKEIDKSKDMDKFPYWYGV